MRRDLGRSWFTTIAAISVLITACSGTASSPVAPGSTPPSTSATASSATERPSAKPAPTWPIGEGQVVYEDWMINAERHQLYIDTLDGSGPRRLVQSAFDDARPAFSPDGAQVLFTRFGDGEDKLIVVNVDGSHLQVLRDGLCGDACQGDNEGDSWSPDGKRFVVKRAYFDAAGNFLKISLLIVRLDGTGTAEVTRHKVGDDFEDIEPDWSPDGRRIAFARVDHSTDPERDAIFTIGIDGKHLQQVTPWELGASEPDWSPDGARIAFNVPGRTFLGGEQNIYTIRPDGTDLRQVTAHLEMADNGVQATFDPCWSPDGTQLIFTHFPSTDGLADLFVVDSDGSDLHPFVESPRLNESHASWGVDPT
jgi:Tol biopolymer transport system component